MSIALIFAAILETVKLQLLFSYLFLALGRPLPYLPGTAVFFFALILRRILRTPGRKVVFLHTAGIAASFCMLYAAFRGPVPDLRFIFTRIAGDPLHAFIIMMMAFAWWFRGAWFGGKTIDGMFCVARFDEGLGVFMVSLGFAALVRVDNPAASGLITPFFLFSIAALSASRNVQSRRGAFSRGSRRMTILAGAAVVVIGAWGISLLVPFLFEPAAGAGESLRNAAVEIEPYMASLMRLLFGRTSIRNDPAASPPTGVEMMPAGSDGGPEFFGRILAAVFMWGFGILLGTLVLFLAAFWLYRLVRYLVSRAERRGRGFRFPIDVLQLLLSKVRRFFVSAGSAAERLMRKRDPAHAAFAKLLFCGRLAGFPRKNCETPREYAGRLSVRFPRSTRHVPFIVDELEKAVYGERPSDPETARLLRAARTGTGFCRFIAERILSRSGGTGRDAG